MTKVGQLRVWHIPQIPGEPFHVYVESVEEAIKVLDILADYDIFQYRNKIKPDYSNAAGLEVHDGCDIWCEWENEEGDTLDEIKRNA